MSEAIKLSSPATREFWEIPVLFEDEHLLALDSALARLISIFHDYVAPQPAAIRATCHGRDGVPIDACTIQP